MIMSKLPKESQDGADIKASKMNDESDEFLKLLKKTQSQVSSLENEIHRVEAENIHQD